MSFNLKLIEIEKCVSFVMTKFGESEIYCKPACKSATMHQESIHVRQFFSLVIFIGSFQYSKLGEKNVEFLQQSRRTPNALGETLCSDMAAEFYIRLINSN